METKTISIDIKADLSQTEYNENAGVMWEHNATQLVFNLDDCFVGDYRYYIEYRSLLGTKVRTDYLELNGKTITYPVPVSMTSLKSVECYFNIISIDEDGNTTQVIKPRKFCLEFDFSPDTDNSIAKVNDFSINSLLEAIRLGTFKGDKGDTGDKGDKGEKGDKGDAGEVPYNYVNCNFANAIKKTVSGEYIKVDDVSVVDHPLKLSLTNYENCNSIRVCGKNLFDLRNSKGFFSAYGGLETQIVDDTITVTCSVPKRSGYLDLGSFPAGTYFLSSGEQNLHILVGDDFASASAAGLTTPTKVTITSPKNFVVYYEFASADGAVSFSNIQVELGDKNTGYETPDVLTCTVNEVGSVTDAVSKSPNMTIISDVGGVTINCEYNRDLNKIIEKLEDAIL